MKKLALVAVMAAVLAPAVNMLATCPCTARRTYKSAPARTVKKAPAYKQKSCKTCK